MADMGGQLPNPETIDVGKVKEEATVASSLAACTVPPSRLGLINDDALIGAGIGMAGGAVVGGVGLGVAGGIVGGPPVAAGGVIVGTSGGAAVGFGLGAGVGAAVGVVKVMEGKKSEPRVSHDCVKQKINTALGLGR